MAIGIPRYSIDSSALIHAYRRAYPPSVLPSLWDDRLPGLIANGSLIASKEVLNELKKKDDELFEWCQNHPNMFIELDDEQQAAMGQIMGKYPKLVDTSKGKSGADPFVIALAQTHKPPLTVITQEEPRNERNPRIPDVCRIEDVPCVNILDFIIEQGWTFS